MGADRLRWLAARRWAAGLAGIFVTGALAGTAEGTPAPAQRVAAARDAGASPPAAGADPAAAPACRAALAALQAEEARLAGRTAVGADPGPAWRALRERAARACLGGPATRPAPPAQPPQALRPGAPARPGGAAGPPAAPPLQRAQAALPPPPVVPPGSGMPVTVVACDVTGCTASDGSRLTRSGPHLVGPRGACTLEGAVLRCPP